MSEWRTVEMPTHPISGGRWVAVVERVRDNASGEVREHLSELPLYDGSAHPQTFNWANGNFACDCNRGLVFLWAAGIDTDDLPDDEPPCGDSRYAAQLVNPVDGAVFFSDFEREKR